MSRDEMRATFIVALLDAFADEENRQLGFMPTIDLDKIEATEMTIEMFYAIFAVFKRLTDSEEDPLGFIGILTRLLFQEKSKYIKEFEESED